MLHVSGRASLLSHYAVSVVTGIPMEFQFGTNWAAFSQNFPAMSASGQTLAMEGMFAFFLESAWSGRWVWGEKRLGSRNHFLVPLPWVLALGSWLSATSFLRDQLRSCNIPWATRWRRTAHCVWKAAAFLFRPLGRSSCSCTINAPPSSPAPFNLSRQSAHVSTLRQHILIGTSFAIFSKWRRWWDCVCTLAASRLSNGRPSRRRSVGKTPAAGPVTLRGHGGTFSYFNRCGT